MQPGYVLHPRVEVEVDDEDESCESCHGCFPLVDCAAVDAVWNRRIVLINRLEANEEDHS